VYTVVRSELVHIETATTTYALHCALRAVHGVLLTRVLPCCVHPVGSNRVAHPSIAASPAATAVQLLDELDSFTQLRYRGLRGCCVCLWCMVGAVMMEEMQIFLHCGN
jgi:hypothetical protein